MSDQPTMICIADDDAAALLDYLDDAADGLAEYGAPSSAFDDLDAMRRRLHMAIYGAEAMPTVEKPRSPDEQRVFDDHLAGWFTALSPAPTPLLARLLKADPPASSVITWGWATNTQGDE